MRSNRAIATAEVVEEMISLAGTIHAAVRRDEGKGLSEDEAPDRS